MNFENFEIVAPRLNANDEKMEIIKWLVKDDEFVEDGQELIEVETAKATSVIHAKASGYLQKRRGVGEVIKVNEVMGVLTKNQGLGKTPPKESSLYQKHLSAFHGKTLPVDQPSLKNLGVNQTFSVQGSLGFTKFSKAAAAYLAEMNIDPAAFKGMGLLTKKSVAKLIQPMAFAVTDHKPQVTQMPIDCIPQSDPRALKTERVSLGKQREIALLTSGQSGLVNSSLTVSFDSLGVRQTLRSFGGGDQMIALILFELAQLVKTYPRCNAYFAGNEIRFYEAVNFGVAIDLEKGLKVPVICDVDQKSITEISKSITDFAIKYLDNKLGPADLENGTITITDLSNDGISVFQPLLNQNQSIILGVGGDKAKANFPMTLTMVFDHRVLAGREVSSLLNELKDRIMTYDEAELPEHSQKAFMMNAKCQSCQKSATDLELTHSKKPVYLFLIAGSGKHPKYVCNICSSK